jgi:hypothetical protein
LAPDEQEYFREKTPGKCQVAARLKAAGGLRKPEIPILWLTNRKNNINLSTKVRKSE